jgi:hypothetical protein
MRVLMNINGTVYMSASSSRSALLFPILYAILEGYSTRGYVLRMSVRTEDTRLINRAFTLPSSRPPKPGSDADAVQPTIRGMSARDSRRRVLCVRI